MGARKDVLARAIERNYDSISEAARRIGIDNSYLGKVTRGERQPTERMARRIAAKLGLSLQGVLGGEPPGETPSERMARNRRQNKKMLKALAAVHATEAFAAKMRRAGAKGAAARRRKQSR
jgi:transcriptional regulator with XRE-family HTH domain